MADVTVELDDLDFAGDDKVVPFQVEGLDVRGRAVQVGPLLNAILERHDYPPAVARLLAEATVLTALIGTSLKFSGKLTVQTKGDGPVDLLVADFTAPESMRAYARFDEERLAEAIGLTFQQVQKYERGANRVGSSRLFDLAKVLDVAVSYFFEDMSSTVAAKTPSRMRGFAETRPEPFEPDPMARRETLELVRAYYRITDPQVRKRVFELAKTLGRTRRADA